MKLDSIRASHRRLHNSELAKKTSPAISERSSQPQVTDKVYDISQIEKLFNQVVSDIKETNRPRKPHFRTAKNTSIDNLDQARAIEEKEKVQQSIRSIVNEFGQIKKIKEGEVKLPDISCHVIASKASKVSRLENALRGGEKSQSMKVIKQSYASSKDKQVKIMDALNKLKLVNYEIMEKPQPQKRKPDISFDTETL